MDKELNEEEFIISDVEKLKIETEARMKTEKLLIERKIHEEKMNAIVRSITVSFICITCMVFFICVCGKSSSSKTEGYDVDRCLQNKMYVDCVNDMKTLDPEVLKSEKISISSECRIFSRSASIRPVKDIPKGCSVAGEQ